MILGLVTLAGTEPAAAAVDPDAVPSLSHVEQDAGPIEVDAGWEVEAARETATRPRLRPRGEDFVQLTALEPSAVLHGLLLPDPAAPRRLIGDVGLAAFWLSAFAILVAGSVARAELGARARRRAWRSRTLGLYAT